MTRKKKEVERCVVCGVKATKHIANFKHSAICNNVVCFHTRVDDINKQVIEQLLGGSDE
jgi:hypothetical protein